MKTRKNSILGIAEKVFGPFVAVVAAIMMIGGGLITYIRERNEMAREVR